MKSDDEILEAGGTQEDIDNYAHDVGGACGGLYGGTCDHPTCIYYKPTIKYFVHPGRVKSLSDGDVHWITGEQLISLYNVDPRECKIILKPDDERGYDVASFKHLYPRMDGNYGSNR